MWTSNYQSSGILYNGSNSFDEDPVITECSRPVHRGSNVRTLNSPLRNSGESSEGEFVEEEKPWPPEHGVRNGRTKNKGGGGLGTRVPRPHSHLFMLGGRARASRHSRRWANSMFLNSIYNIPEEELEESMSILPSHESPFTRLHTSDKNMQIWSSFMSCSEEEQCCITSPSPVMSTVGVARQLAELDIVDTNNLPEEQKEESLHGEKFCEGASYSPGDIQRVAESLRSLDPRIRDVLRHDKHLPIGTICTLEEELVGYFQLAGPQAIFLALQSNSFIRLLLHGLSQYLGLKSRTEKVAGGQVVMVEQKTSCPFIPPSAPLSLYLQSKTKPK